MSGLLLGIPKVHWIVVPIHPAEGSSQSGGARTRVLGFVLQGVVAEISSEVLQASALPAPAQIFGEVA